MRKRHVLSTSRCPPPGRGIRQGLSYSGSIPKPVIVAVYVILLYHVGCRGYACMALNGGAALEDLKTVSSVGFVVCRNYSFSSTLEFGQGILDSTDQQMRRDDASHDILSSPS